MPFHDFAEAERAGWDRRAAGYGATTARATTQAIPSLLAAARVASGTCMIDVCCGPGYAAGAAAALGAEATGVDVSPAMIAAARAAFPACRFDAGDAATLPAADHAFDAAVCGFGLFHLADPAAALAEMRRVLRPGGRIALSQWAGPAASPFFKVVFGALGAHADMTVAPPGPPPFALSSVDALEAALIEAGFEDASVEETPVLLEAPAEGFAEFFRAFAVRGQMILERQSEEVRARIEEAWRDGFSPFVRNGALRVPMPSLVAAARRP